MTNSINSGLLKDSKWIGRFAPSPTGALHFGSLVAALGSYMIAKQKGGYWLVRIEDLDPPREVAGSAKSILTTLESFGLHWDREVVYQSQRNSIYQQKLKELIQQQIVYQCDCSRKQIQVRSHGIYDGFCRQRILNQPNIKTLRIKFSEGFSSFTDEILGYCQFNSQADLQDYIIRRRDGLFAYQLAVVVDDIEQGVNHVVRGQDILNSTPRQNFLYHCLGHPAPHYYHLPLVKNAKGIKLGKSTDSQALNTKKAATLLLRALSHLGQSIDSEMAQSTPSEIIEHYIRNWQTNKINNQRK